MDTSSEVDTTADTDIQTVRAHPPFGVGSGLLKRNGESSKKHW